MFVFLCSIVGYSTSDHKSYHLHENVKKLLSENTYAKSHFIGNNATPSKIDDNLMKILKKLKTAEKVIFKTKDGERITEEKYTSHV